MEAAGVMKMMVVESGCFSLGNSGKQQQQQQKLRPFARSSSSSLSLRQSTRTSGLCVSAAVADGSNKSGMKKGVPNSNYVVPLDNPPNSSCLTRPLVEILRDLNKRVPDKIIKTDAVHSQNYIPWYHANRMLSFFAPGWCGEIRNILFSDDGNVTVVYRLTIRGSDGEAFRESCGTTSTNDGQIEDVVAEAEVIAFCRACARFGLGLYLYHEDEVL